MNGRWGFVGGVQLVPLLTTFRDFFLIVYLLKLMSAFYILLGSNQQNIVL